MTLVAPYKFSCNSCGGDYRSYNPLGDFECYQCQTKINSEPLINKPAVVIDTTNAITSKGSELHRKAIEKINSTPKEKELTLELLKVQNEVKELREEIRFLKTENLLFVKWLGERKFTKHQVNDRWYDSERDYEFVGNTEDIRKMFEEDQQWRTDNL